MTGDDILDATRNEQAPPESIPDLDNLLNTIIEFLEYIETDEMQKMEETDKAGFEKHLDEKFSTFTLRYYGIFKMLLEKKGRAENVHKLINLFSELNKVKSGAKNMDTVYSEYTEGLNNEYIYSKYGGKENFEKALTKKEEKRKKIKRRKKRSVETEKKRKEKKEKKKLKEKIKEINIYFYIYVYLAVDIICWTLSIILVVELLT